MWFPVVNFFKRVITEVLFSIVALTHIRTVLRPRQCVSNVNAADVSVLNCKRTPWNKVQKFMFKRSFCPCMRLFYDTLCTYSISVGFSLLRVCFSAYFVYACFTNVLVNRDWYMSERKLKKTARIKKCRYFLTGTHIEGSWEIFPPSHGTSVDNTYKDYVLCAQQMYAQLTERGMRRRARPWKLRASCIIIIISCWCGLMAGC